MKIYDFQKNFIEGCELPSAVVYQISELSLMRNSEMPEHIQICDEITYVLSGKAKVISAEECTDISAGQIHFIKKGVLHKFEVYPGEDFRYICVGYIPNEEDSLVKSFVETVKNIKYIVLDDDSTVKKLTSLMVDESYDWDEHSKIMISHYISQILIAVARLINGKSCKISNKQNESAMSKNTIYKVLRYIDREYLNIRNVKEISDNISYSEYYISHLFKEKIGVTIKEYITQKKMSHACELLRTSPLEIEEISEYLNFASSHSFRRVFKSVVGVSPREYKNNIQQNLSFK